MAHLPLRQLNDMLLSAAASQVKVGGRYAHYKHPEILYLVAGLAILEATDEVAVIYRTTDDDVHVTFVRPLRSWLETITWNGQSLPRFKLIDS